MLIKLDKVDRRILFELDKNARIPETRLAKIVGKSKESVRYRIKQLQQKKVITGYTVWVDPTKLGYHSAKIYLTLANKPKQKKAFVNDVIQDKRLFWLGVAEGAWNAGLTYFVKSNREFFDLKNELFSKYKDLILESHTGMLVNVEVKDRIYYHKANTCWNPLFGTPEQLTLDDVEKKILKVLFGNARESVVSIAHQAGVSVDIVRRRIKRLEDDRVIFKYHTDVDYHKTGHDLYKTFLYFSNLTKKDERKLMEFTRKLKPVIFMVKQISPWDIELESMCESHEEYRKMLNSLTEEFADSINKVETAIVGEDYIWPSKEMILK
ncbi:MAG: Lrp/AsnC family transcriptional regulator [Candidatus Nanoarchaeia archaeon]